MSHPSFESLEGGTSGRKAKPLSFEQAICNQVICLIAGPALLLCLRLSLASSIARHSEDSREQIVGHKSEIDKTSRSVESKTRRMSKFKLTFHFNSIDDFTSGFHFLSCARKTQRGVVKELQAMTRCSFKSNHFQMSGDA